MRNEHVAQAYGFAPGDKFTANFSKASVENVLFYIFATGAWVVENLLDQHKRDVNAYVGQSTPHTLVWYCNLVRNFMYGKALDRETGRYDTTGMKEHEIESARVVKYAVAAEDRNSSVLTIKIAGEQDGMRTRLAPEVEELIREYIYETKDAGVQIELVNEEGDPFWCEVCVKYDAMLVPREVEEACSQAIAKYVENLPFDGEYSNMALIDRLQEIEGVRIAEMVKAWTVSEDRRDALIEVSHTPLAGYFKVAPNGITLTMEPQ